MANNYPLRKEILNKIVDGKNVRAINRYLQFYRILATFASVKSWSLKYKYLALALPIFAIDIFFTTIPLDYKFL